jgi:hypothetical protein
VPEEPVEPVVPDTLWVWSVLVVLFVMLAYPVDVACVEALHQFESGPDEVPPIKPSLV